LRIVRAATVLAIGLVLSTRAGAAPNAQNPNAVWSGPSGTWLVGAAGLVLHAKPGSDERAAIAGPDATDLFGVYGDGAVVIAVGDGGAIWRSTDGEHFAAVTSPTDKPLSKVWGSGSDFYAVGAEGTILRSSDGGATWKLLESKSEVPLWGVWGLNASEVLVVGDGGLVLRTRDGGATWKKEGTETDANLVAVRSVGGMLYAVGGAGTILRSSDGAKWEKLTSPTENFLNALWSPGANDLWIVGNGGVMLHATDGKSFQLTTTGEADLLGVTGDGHEKPLVVGYTRVPRGLLFTDAALNLIGIFVFLGLIAIVKPPKHVPKPS
jgi:photosystem II stability/assembly factor-like uncharacterized protein